MFQGLVGAVKSLPHLNAYEDESKAYHVSQAELDALSLDDYRATFNLIDAISSHLIRYKEFRQAYDLCHSVDRLVVPTHLQAINNLQRKLNEVSKSLEKQPKSNALLAEKKQLGKRIATLKEEKQKGASLLAINEYHRKRAEKEAVKKGMEAYEEAKRQKRVAKEAKRKGLAPPPVKPTSRSSKLLADKSVIKPKAKLEETAEEREERLAAKAERERKKAARVEEEEAKKDARKKEREENRKQATEWAATMKGVEGALVGRAQP